MLLIKHIYNENILLPYVCVYLLDKGHSQALNVLTVKVCSGLIQGENATV